MTLLYTSDLEFYEPYSTWVLRLQVNFDFAIIELCQVSDECFLYVYSAFDAPKHKLKHGARCASKHIRTFHN